MKKQLARKIIARHTVYVRVSASASHSVEFYSPFFIDGNERVGASPGDVFDVIEESKEGVLVSKPGIGEIWISDRLLWKFEKF
jgi:hypothetical protein